MTPLSKDPRGADQEIYISLSLKFIAFKNSVQVNTNYRKLLQPCMHHEEGIQHLTSGQLKPQLGFIKGGEKRCLTSPGGDLQME